MLCLQVNTFPPLGHRVSGFVIAFGFLRVPSADIIADLLAASKEVCPTFSSRSARLGV